MTLTVRLPQTLDHALDEYCSSHGLSKSHVVQESLAQYLVQQQAPRTQPVSANYAAFKRAGLIGCVHGEGESATKEAVRRRMSAKLKSGG